ncbi:MAG: hypothetical protein QOI12_1960 [Alphaproteobacteria bacterium]|jgi:hypothetical protein|nr:hypothetical protein [Alphaproteobacteria bacterium]
MNRTVMAFTLVTLLAMPAHAQLARTFLSANGSDANTCSRTAPCRTLQVAHNNTTAGGEINMLDPAGYGRVVIQKSISIVNDGVGSAGILVPASSIGIRIIAGPSDKIHLRGLIIEGAGVGEYGIVFESGKSLHVENSVIRNMTISGIAFITNGGEQDTNNLSVSNTLVADNGSHGIVVQPSGSAFVYSVFNRVEVSNNGENGIAVFGNRNVGRTWTSVVDSLSAQNTGIGFYIFNDNPASWRTHMDIFKSTSSFNQRFGVVAEGSNASFILGQSAVVLNGYLVGLSQAAALDGALGESYGDNYVYPEKNLTIKPKS